MKILSIFLAILTLASAGAAGYMYIERSKLTEQVKLQLNQTNQLSAEITQVQEQMESLKQELSEKNENIKALTTEVEELRTFKQDTVKVRNKITQEEALLYGLDSADSDVFIDLGDYKRLILLLKPKEYMTAANINDTVSYDEATALLVKILMDIPDIKEADVADIKKNKYSVFSTQVQYQRQVYKGLMYDVIFADKLSDATYSYEGASNLSLITAIRAMCRLFGVPEEGIKEVLRINANIQDEHLLTHVELLELLSRFMVIYKNGKLAVLDYISNAKYEASKYMLRQNLELSYFIR